MFYQKLADAKRQTPLVRMLVTHDKNTMPTHFGDFITKIESPLARVYY